MASDFNMDDIQRSLPWFYSLILLVLLISHPCCAYDATASYYGPPYLPSSCYGENSAELPGDMLFAAAGAGIWSDGAACGSIVHVKSIDDDEIFKVKIVDYIGTASSPVSAPNTAVALPRPTFKNITGSSALWAKIQILRK
ncbi:hypothetical protein NMG60_11013333 [Bertholletia excelsa]